MITSNKKELHCRHETIDEEFQKFIQNDRVIVNTSVSKQDYYKLLAISHVVLSTAYQETFGYGTLEATLCGCTPVVPEKLSYTDLLQNDTRLFYNTQGEAVEKILKYCEHPINVSHYAKRYDLQNTIGKMLKEMELVL